jgi:ActR/RegA family two-component response regulator
VSYRFENRAITMANKMQKKHKEGKIMTKEKVTGLKTLSGLKGLITVLGLENGLKETLGLSKESMYELRSAKKEEDVKLKPILIVEDETIMRESVRDWLTDIGYQVETAETGEQALEILGEKDFGLLILDLRLPGKDGIQILREARSRRPKLRGIIITAYPSVETAVEAIKDGAIEYLPKPFELNHLERVIRDSLGPIQLEIRPKVSSNK